MYHIRPGDKAKGNTTVVASVIYTDQPDVGTEPIWTVLLLNQTSPYFSVALVSGEGWWVYYEDLGSFYNIVEAVACYEDHGGDI